MHGDDRDRLSHAGQAILEGIGLTGSAPLKPRILYSDVIEDIADQHAVIINRNRQASMIMPGQTLLICEMAPALYAALAANEAERAAPDLTLVDVQMIGAAGRIFLSGTTPDVERAKDRIERTLEDITGRAS